MKSLEEFLGDVFKYKLKTPSTHELRTSYKYANGCGSKGGYKVPKTMWGVNIESACISHDIEWMLARDYEELKEANSNFARNLKRITDYESMNNFTRWIRRYRISSYTSGVALKGTPVYAKERGFTDE